MGLLIDGLLVALQPYHLVLMSFGIIAGIVIGTLPGLTATMATALLVPFTFHMDPATGLVLLGAIWCAGVYGGANSAILLNIPGTPSSFTTTLDGYPLTRKGQADRALFTSLFASVLGGIFGVLILILLFAPLAKLSVKFGKAEYFWLCVFGLTAISTLTTKNPVKGILACALGLLIGTIGLSPIDGTPRFTFGYRPMVQGIALIPALIGMFALAQVFQLIKRDERYIAEYRQNSGVIRSVVGYMAAKCKVVFLRSSIIGTFIGILPGAGGAIASIIAYNEAKRWDKHPEKYGTGAIEGIVASESANNAMIGGACIPMMSLGIPGAPVAAVIMGGLLAHGITPGAKLLVESGDVAYTFIASLLVSNILLLIIGYFMLKLTSNILRIPTAFIAPAVLVLSTIGAFSMRNSMLDLVAMLLLGLFAFYFLSDTGPAPMALGLVLGPIAEEALGVTLQIARAKGSVMQALVLRPVSLILIVMSILAIVGPIVLQRVFRKEVT
jgi:putative tricarboxylic transport membrane protein